MPPVLPTEEEILGLIYDQLVNSTKITAGVVANNELTLTGNTDGDDFTINSSSILLNIGLVSVQELFEENDILQLIKTELEKSDKVDYSIFNHDTWGTPNSSGLIIYHTATASDTIEYLKSLYGVDENTFRGWNSLSQGDDIVVGTEYIVWKDETTIDLSSPDSRLRDGHGGYTANSQDTYKPAERAFNGSSSWWRTLNESGSPTTISDGTVIKGHWIQIDMGKETILTSFGITATKDTGSGRQIRQAKMFTSLTGTDDTWVEIYAINNNNINITETYNITSDNQIIGRFYRIVITESHNNKHQELSEITIKGYSFDEAEKYSIIKPVEIMRLHC